MLDKLVVTKDQPNYGLACVADTAYYKRLKAAATVSFLIMLLAQTLVLILFNGPQIGDADTYLQYAIQCARHNLWYPAAEHVSEPFFFGNGMVNLVGLILRITPSLKVVFFLNILFTQMLFWSCLFLVKKLFNRPTLCFWFTILFCLLNTFWSEIAHVRTELSFCALAFAGCALLCIDKKWAIPAAGVLLALANWFRPLGLAFLISAVCAMILMRKRWWHVLSLLGSYAAVILVIGSVSLASCGHFVYQSTTFGFNLIMSAHDDADGSYMNVTDEGQVGYIPPEQAANMTFKDYDEYYTELSLDWIRQHPMGYLKQIPAKLFFLYSTETYSGSAYFNNEVNTSGFSYIRAVADKLIGRSDDPLHPGDVLIVLNQIWYMLIVGLFAVGTVLAVRKKQWRRMLPLWLSMLLGTGITVLVVGGARYHFPFLPTMMIGAAFACEYLFAGERKRAVQS